MDIFINEKKSSKCIKIAGYSALKELPDKEKPVLPFFNYTNTFEKCVIGSEKPFVDIEDYTVLIKGSIIEIKSEDFIFSRFNNKQEELVAAMYRQYGEEFYSLLDGNFLIILFDKILHRWFVFNNRYEATAFYYYLNDSIFIFATSVKLLLNILPFKPRFSLSSVPSFLNTGFSYTEKTQFEHIFRLLPTYRIMFDGDGVDFKNHWKGEFIFNRKNIDNIEKKLDEYEYLFSKSIKNFIEYHKPKQLGCFLSGGHDTSLTFIKAAELYKKPIHTFTASFENYGFDEAPKARYLTERYNGIHHTVLIGQNELDLIPLMVRMAEEPVPGGGFPIFVCTLEASKYVDCILTGDAGDTLWGEYYPVAEWHKYLKNIPYSIRKFIHALNKFILKFNDWERFWESEHVFALFAKRNMYENFFRKLSSYRHFRNELLDETLNQDIFQNVEMDTCMLDIPFTRHNMHDALIEAKMFYGVYQYMIPPTQKPLEAMGVSFYAPYFNHNLISFINSLPEDWLNGGNTFKKLINDAHKRRFHKKVLLRYLSPRYVYAVQQSLDVPFHSLLPKRPDILNILLQRLKRRGWYNNEVLERLFDEFPKQAVKPYEIHELKHHGYRIFCLLSFEVWCMEFIDKQLLDRKNKDDIIPLEEYLSR